LVFREGTERRRKQRRGRSDSGQARGEVVEVEKGISARRKGNECLIDMKNKK
jgi:hypothetical protein